VSERISARLFHPAEFIYDELLERGWTTWAAVQAAGGDERDCLALDLYLCIQAPGCRLGNLAETLAKAFDVSQELFTNLESMWLKAPERSERFDPPEWIFAASPLQPIANLGAAETPHSIEQPHQTKIPTQPQGEGS
jgi:plasmid maintenance system antidote protein VapI